MRKVQKNFVLLFIKSHSLFRVAGRALACESRGQGDVNAPTQQQPNFYIVKDLSTCCHFVQVMESQGQLPQQGAGSGPSGIGAEEEFGSLLQVMQRRKLIVCSRGIFFLF